MPPELLLGPVAALAGALVVVRVLWQEHKADDVRILAERDAWKARSEQADKRLSALTELLRKAAPK